MRAVSRLAARNAFATTLVFGPLLWAFFPGHHFFPLTRWALFVAPGNLREEYRFLRLVGETADGETIDVQPCALTSALSVGNLGILQSALANRSLLLPQPHPANAALLLDAGGQERLPPAARLPDLLSAWGARYNRSLPPGSPHRLLALRLERCHCRILDAGPGPAVVEQTWRTPL